MELFLESKKKSSQAALRVLEQALNSVSGTGSTRRFFIRVFPSLAGAPRDQIIKINHFKSVSIRILVPIIGFTELGAGNRDRRSRDIRSEPELRIKNPCLLRKVLTGEEELINVIYLWSWCSILIVSHSHIAIALLIKSSQLPPLDYVNFRSFPLTAHAVTV